MKVCVVTVTYGNRFKFLKQVIEASLKEDVCKIIAVDNGSEKESKEKLKELEKKLKNKLKVIYLPQNEGSAGGFKKGLEEAYNDPDCEFIWLLDDDNVPKQGSLKRLIELYKKLCENKKCNEIALLSHRKDRLEYVQAVIENNPFIVRGRENSFLGFHIIDLPKKVLKLIKKKLGLNYFKEAQNITYGEVSLAPYGGLFFPKKLINKIGYPKEEFFVYSDDHEWTYRITENNGKIFAVLNSEIKDIDSSWYLKGNTTSPFYSFLNKGSDFRVYYSVRNRVNFESRFIKNNFIYKINKLLFFSILFLYKKNSNFHRYNLIKKAVQDGSKNKLGKYL